MCYRDKSPLNVHNTQLTGAAILSKAVIALCLFTHGLEPIKAIGWGSLVWTAEYARELLNDVPKKLTTNPAPGYFWYLINLVCLHACFSGAEYGKKFLVAYSAFSPPT